MKQKWYTEEQIIRFPKAHDAGAKVTDLIEGARLLGTELLPLEEQIRWHGGLGG